MFLIFDIGGTKMRLALSKDGVTFEEPFITETPKDFEDGLEVFKNFAGEQKIEAVAGGIAGPLGKEHSSLIGSPNISTWIGKPLKEELEKIFNAPVYLENDSALVGLGEATAGAGKNKKIVVYITVSTGVGGARIVDGKIDVHRNDFEPGHQIIDFNNSLCPDCDGPYLGSLISGTGIEKRTGKKPYDVHDKNAWSQMSEWLAIGLNNVIVFWTPDIVVLGGPSIVGDPAIDVGETIGHLKKMLKIYPELPEIKEAELKDLGGLYGALELLSQKNR